MDIDVVKEVRSRAKLLPTDDLASKLGTTERTVRRFISGENMLQVKAFLTMLGIVGLEVREKQ